MDCLYKVPYKVNPVLPEKCLMPSATPLMSKEFFLQSKAMDYQASPRCMLCSGGIGLPEWTKRFVTVLLKDQDIDIGLLAYDKNHMPQQSKSQISNNQQTEIRLNPSSSSFTPTKAFLVHVSCNHLLKKLSKSAIQPYQLFKLCQALQPDQQRKFKIVAKNDLSGCLDPSMSLISRKPILPKLDLEPRWDAASDNISSLLRLPPEIMLMILEYLPPSHVIRFLGVSKQALLYSNEFCARNPHYFYYCSDDSIDKRYLIIALAMRFSGSNYRELDLRWEVVSRIAKIARLASLIHENYIDTQTLNPRAPLQPFDHRFGLNEAVLQIPDYIDAVDVYSTFIKDHYYVCGIGFQSKKAYSFHGRRTGILQRSDFPDTAIDSIGFEVDALGIRRIKWGYSQGSFGGLANTGCWEGLSIKQKHQKIRIIYDALKFRYLSWCNDSSPSFAETLLMKGGHACLSRSGYISQDYYVTQHRMWERQLIAEFGNFTTEALWFGKDLQSITVYSGDRLDGIFGISIKTSSNTSCVGTCCTERKSITLDAPREIVTEIDTQVSNFYSLSITLKTNYGRRLCSHSEPPTPGISVNTTTLRPPPMYYITGLYFRLGDMCIGSIGLIYAA